MGLVQGGGTAGHRPPGSPEHYLRARARHQMIRHPHPGREERFERFAIGRIERRCLHLVPQTRGRPGKPVSVASNDCHGRTAFRKAAGNSLADP